MNLKRCDRALADAKGQLEEAAIQHARAVCATEMLGDARKAHDEYTEQKHKASVLSPPTGATSARHVPATQKRRVGHRDTLDGVQDAYSDTEGSSSRKRHRPNFTPDAPDLAVPEVEDSGWLAPRTFFVAITLRTSGRKVLTSLLSRQCSFSQLVTIRVLR